MVLEVFGGLFGLVFGWLFVASAVYYGVKQALKEHDGDFRPRPDESEGRSGDG